jgi:hypothetical protein
MVDCSANHHAGTCVAETGIRVTRNECDRKVAINYGLLTLVSGHVMCAVGFALISASATFNELSCVCSIQTTILCGAVMRGVIGFTLL